MEVSNELVAIVVVAAIVVSMAGTFTTMNVLDQITTQRGDDVTGYLSGLVNVTVNESVIITWVVNSINFTVNTRESGLTPIEDDTTDHDPGPFIVRNDGGSNANVTIYAGDDLWSAAGYRTVSDGAGFHCRRKSG